MASLHKALEEANRDGMSDLVNIRAILLEYAALHALRILPDSEGKMTQIAAHALSKRLPVLSASVPCN